jgi:hypothetical protein
MKEASQDARTPENGSGNQPSTAKDHSWQGRMQQEPASDQSTPDDLLAQLTLSEARTQIYEVDSNGGFAAHTSEESTEDLRSQLDWEPPVEARSLEIDASETGLAKTDPAITWSSAAQARDALEELAVSQKQSGFAGFWNARRADIYLAIAVILMAGVIRWGLWSNHSVNASRTGGNHRRQVPDADLSVFDKLLIGVGLAEAPDAPEYKGNPETQVWVDLHTALYYCPNAGLYGKTPKGKFTTQRDAQLDQFEPAYRKACD